MRLELLFAIYFRIICCYNEKNGRVNFVDVWFAGNCIGYCNGFFHRLYLVEDVLLPIIIITLDDFIFNFITFIIFFVMRNRLSFGLYMKDIILPDMIYTAILTMIVFKLFVFINKRLKRAEKGSET